MRIAHSARLGSSWTLGPPPLGRALMDLARFLIRHRAAVATALLASGALVASTTPGTAAQVAPAQAPYTEKTPVSRGTGGAVSSVDPEATRIGLRVLKRGGNAVDAAVATAAALG